MRIDVTTPADFLKYYSEAFVKSKTEERGVYYVVGHDNISISVRSVNAEGAFSDLRSLKFSTLENEIYFGLPPLGMVVYRDLLLFLAQNFKRSGARGLSRYRGNLYTLSTDTPLYSEYFAQFHGAPSMQLMAFDGNFAREVLWPEYTHSFQAAAELCLAGKKAACAIDRNFGLYLSDSLRYPILCYKTEKIGEIRDPSTVGLLKMFEGYRPVLTDAIGVEKMEVRIC